MLNQITFEHVKRHLVSEKNTKKEQTTQKICCQFLYPYWYCTQITWIRRETQLGSEKQLLKIWNCCLGLSTFNYICVNLVPPNKSYSTYGISLFLLTKHPLLLSLFFKFFSLPLSGPRHGGGTMKNISKISKTLNIYLLE